MVFSLYIFSYAYVIFGYAKKKKFFFAVLFTSNRGEVGTGSGILLLGFFGSSGFYWAFIGCLLGFNWVASMDLVLPQWKLWMPESSSISLWVQVWLKIHWVVWVNWKFPTPLRFRITGLPEFTANIRICNENSIVPKAN